MMKVETDLQDLRISFSHVHLYVDYVEDLSVYLTREQKPTTNTTSENNDAVLPPAVADSLFVSHNRDVVHQLLVGLGFRITGHRYDSSTRTVLVTSCDPRGVQFVVTSLAKTAIKDNNNNNNNNNNKTLEHDIVEDSKEGADTTTTSYRHFAAENLHRFYKAHDDRQGVAVLAFEVDNLDGIQQRYHQLHPQLIVHDMEEYDDGVRIMEVFAYYDATPDGSEPTNTKRADSGTVLRFLERTDCLTETQCSLPGLSYIAAEFNDDAQAAYCDHWVSNVFSRTDFLNTLQDTLGFTPKVDFNAGVVAAGEAQIESTVTGNDSDFITRDKVLTDQSQVYLPINNALSPVGHVSGFLDEVGQGIQHIASRVDDLISFVQKANERRIRTGEGFTFLRIPRSYYGILTKQQLEQVVSDGCAQNLLLACDKTGITGTDGSVDLALTYSQVQERLDAEGLKDKHATEYKDNKEAVIGTILKSRYVNLHNLLQHHLSEESYLGIVRNQILVDVQGEDLLYQIFTCNMLQRHAGEEAPFLEFIQRVCSECKDEGGCAKIKPGCGGFGIRNFLTLFLSIEVSKAMADVAQAKAEGNERKRVYAQQMVECFTAQLNEANPILTEISDAMTKEGNYRQQLLEKGTDRPDMEKKIQQARERKEAGNRRLMECSAKYKKLMKTIRERRIEDLGE